MPGSIFRPLIQSLTTLLSIARDLVHLLVLVSRSRRALAAENLSDEPFDPWLLQHRVWHKYQFAVGDWHLPPATSCRLPDSPPPLDGGSPLGIRSRLVDAVGRNYRVLSALK